MATVDTTLFDCDVLWLDAHDAIVHWHNGRVYIDVRRDDGLRVQENCGVTREASSGARVAASCDAQDRACLCDCEACDRASVAQGRCPTFGRSYAGGEERFFGPVQLSLFEVSACPG